MNFLLRSSLFAHVIQLNLLLFVPPHPTKKLMVWTIDLPRLGTNRKHFTALIKSKNEELVEENPHLKNILASSNVSFEAFVSSIRKVVEDAYPDEHVRPYHVKQLLSNTNWANHGQKNTKFASTDVTVDHCLSMVDFFTQFVDDYEYNPESVIDALCQQTKTKAVISPNKNFEIVTCSSPDCTQTFSPPPFFKGKNPRCVNCRNMCKLGAR